MLQLDSQPARGRHRKLSVSLATTKETIRAAQALRYKVFAEELGARLSTREPGLDIDLYDAWCDHLVVRDDASNEVVGTYRILPPSQALRLGSYYSESEFDLTRLQHLRAGMVELGRSCVHADYRNGATIALLWAGLAEYMQRNRCDYLVGCASISMADGGHMAASIYRELQQKSMSPVEWRVFPRCPLPLDALDGKQIVDIPPLLKGYLRLGAYVCGDPAWDPDFNTADVLVLLPLSRMNQRYARHFMHAEA
ncbi:GNAT family N-acetyltransferase [Chitinimonas arctica]|uniref:L-ornithine N(alpha)-acyltransferase n=1 Tax=Chitinimonas arctica TaxID=2594795 RepID=A0A516SDY1_9NEIS|nr:GNAT family N-acyltransferase [Chitinimonas arctica]QDQ26355.1 GNAT family N-acetyltransferase [Chitinimonas arctica]